MGQKAFRLGTRARLGELDRFFDLPAHATAYLLETRVIQHAPVAQVRGEARERIPLDPFLDLFVGPVVGRVDVGVPEPAIGLHLDERGPLTGMRALERLARSIPHRNDVVAVDRYAGEPEGPGAVAQVLERGRQMERKRLRPQV